MRVLAIESSCDDTAAAVVGPGAAPGSLLILGQASADQALVHADFGGVVPEVAAREHLAQLVPTVAAAVAAAGGWEAIEAVAATQGPGLVGALLVGLQAAKGLALGRGLPFLGVHHLEGHLWAAQLAAPAPSWPHLALLCSGGHTQLVAVAGPGRYRRVGTTRDDAAGEALDKIAKLLGLGYPGGPALERAACGGQPAAMRWPRARLEAGSWDFSFSGLKAAVARRLDQLGAPPQGGALQDWAASCQEAVVAPLAERAVAAARALGLPGLVLGGGVAANGRLRALVAAAAAAAGLWWMAPPPRLCTDNAAMIGAAARWRLVAGQRSELALSPRPRWPLEAI